MIAGKNIGAWLSVLMFAVLLVVSGCGDEEDTPPLTPVTEANIPDSSLPFPDTPEKLMANFQIIYETRNVEEYKLILDPAFETLLQEGTTLQFPHVGVTLDVTEENRIHERMFSGEDLTDHGGGFIPAILHISFSQFRPVVDWGESLPTDPIPNTLSSMYEVIIIVDRGPSFSALVVMGAIRFYVTTAEGRLNGQPKTYYRLVGQLDLTNIGKVNEEVSWGPLKAWLH